MGYQNTKINSIDNKNLKKRTIVEAPDEISVDSPSTDAVIVPELNLDDQREISSIKTNRERSSSGSTDTSTSSQHSLHTRAIHKAAKWMGLTKESLPRAGGRKTKKSKKPRKTKKPIKYRKKQTRRM